MATRLGLVPTQQLMVAVFLLTLATQVYALPNDDTCPNADELVYSPFRPWFSFWPDAGRQSCWHFASCTFIEADEGRKQQFAATALVMGIIPLTLKDIAWPERRAVPVSKRLPSWMEVFVLALGLVPVISPPGDELRQAAADASPLVRWAWKIQKKLVYLVCVVLFIILMITYAAIAVVEIYSKRSALGCPYPIFVLTWHLFGLVPATAHVVLSNLKARLAEKKELKRCESRTGTDDPAKGEVARARTPSIKEVSSAVQGADEWWIVQLSWAIYYIIGTLIFTSIMALTVLELLAWVVISFAVTGASKLLALFLCLCFEPIPSSS